MSPTATEVTHLRADAARNRAAILDAARAVFAERGLDAPLDEIARQAGVGNATLYRHFPNRCALLSTVFAARLVEITQAVDRALADPDPWTGFAGFVSSLFELQASNRGLADLFTTRVRVDPELERLWTRLQRDTARVAERAKEAGALRADFQPEDLPLLLMANAGLVRRTSSRAPNAWRRILAYTLDGLAAPAARGPAPPSPGLTTVRSMMDEHAVVLLGQMAAS